MKKVIGLLVVILLSSVSVFAQSEGKHAGKTRHNKGGRNHLERLTEELKLSNEQVARFEKLQAEQREKMKAERSLIKADREKQRQLHQEKMIAMRDQRNEEVKKILSEEQYQQYLEKQKAGMERQKDKKNKDREKGNRPHHKGRKPHQRG